MQVISVINYKGGVGKTTVTANLAAELACRGKRVLLLDMDAQASLTFSFVQPDYWEEHLAQNKTIKNWFDCITRRSNAMPIADLVVRPKEINSVLAYKKGAVEMICSHLGLINVDLELANLLSGGSRAQYDESYMQVHGELRSAIKNVATNGYDLVLIDCPPNFNIVTKNALVASDKILIPAKPDHLSTLGIDYLIGSVKKLTNDFNECATRDANTNEANPGFLGVVFTMIGHYGGGPMSVQEQYIAQTERLSKKWGIPIMESTIRANNRTASNAVASGIPMVLNSTKYKPAVADIKKFVDEFVNMTGV